MMLSVLTMQVMIKTQHCTRAGARGLSRSPTSPSVPLMGRQISPYHTRPDSSSANSTNRDTLS